MSTISKSIAIKSSAASFYNLFRNEIYKATTISPENVQTVEVIQGDYTTVGSIIKFSYTIASVQLTVTVKVEAADDTNMTITWSVLDGDVLTLYKTFMVTLQVTADATGGSVTWTIEFEVLGITVPVPDGYLAFAASVTADVDAYLQSA